MTLSLHNANTIITTAFAHARSMNTKPMGCAVIDAGGHLIAYQREDGASLLRFNIATGKAWGAIAMLTDSRTFMEMAETRPSFMQTLAAMTDGKIIPSAGGVLIRNSAGEVLGAVGISGDLPDIDEQCAKAGIAAIF